MSQENVEVAKRSNAALNRGDIDGALEVFAPDARLRDLNSAPDQPVAAEGIEAIRETWSLWIAAFDELRADVEEWIEAGDAVIAAVHWHGTGKDSGIWIDVRQFDLSRFRDGKVTEATLGFKSREEALEAAGLRE
jgi:ketosteroid isomerase-like protein